MGIGSSHICVCICTYKRPQLLENLLTKLHGQKTDGIFTYSVLVVDNDYEQSAKIIVDSFKKESVFPIDYYIEHEKSIALARNKALRNARGDFIAFIDDDEFPVDDWLYNLHKTCRQYNADGVLGPVKPKFETEPPDWIIKGKLFERPSYETGTVLQWYNTRTGNVLLQKYILEKSDNLFRSEFRHSEDQDFFKRMTEQGHVLIWCDEATVYEVQTQDRFKIIYFIRRALLRGNVSLRLQPNKLLIIIKSAVAFVIYTLSLPFLIIIGRHLFIKYLIKDFDHIGKLIASCKIDIQRYLT